MNDDIDPKAAHLKPLQEALHEHTKPARQAYVCVIGEPTGGLFLLSNVCMSREALVQFLLAIAFKLDKEGGPLETPAPVSH